MKLVSEIMNRKGSDKESFHGYGTALYDVLFAPYQNIRVSLLEIGVYWGNSIRAWNEYFEYGRIYGIDSDPKWGLDAWEGHGAATLIGGNAYDQRVVANNFDALRQCDIIIDDGPHGLVNQSAALQLYLPLLSWGGILIIEDIDNESDMRKLIAQREPIYWTRGKSPQSYIGVWQP